MFINIKCSLGTVTDDAFFLIQFFTRPLSFYGLVSTTFSSLISRTLQGHAYVTIHAWLYHFRLLYLNIEFFPHLIFFLILRIIAELCAKYHYQIHDIAVRIRIIQSVLNSQV